MKKLLKKSQMEMFGLAIVVVIILMATIFLVVFFAKKPEARKGFVQSELLSGMIKTLINTDIEEGTCKVEMSDLMKFCLSGKSCGGGSENSCDIVIRVTESIFKETINKWTNEKYYFSFYSSPANPKEINNPCQGDKRFSSYTIPGPPSILVNLEICG